MNRLLIQVGLAVIGFALAISGDSRLPAAELLIGCSAGIGISAA